MAYTTINKSTAHFNSKLFTGNGSNGHAITGVGFQPDFCWLKNRSLAQAHVLVDAVRGNNKILYTSGDGAETTTIADKDFRSFDTDGFTVDANNDFGSTNTNGSNIVSWNWKAGGTASSNTDGDITSSVSANTTAGFSIVSYTANGNAGTRIGHGLGAVPSMIITKDRDASGLWLVYHAKSDSSTPQNKYLELNTNGSVQDYPVWNDTAPTSSVFTIGTASENNTNGRKIIAYCFAEKTGYSKFGSYIGNGNADGTFVYTGFKPAFVLTKTATSTYHWNVNDNKRNTFNPSDKRLYPSQSNAEATSDAYDIDFLSNGFKIRSDSVSFNNSGDNVIYMAFAEAPLVGTNNVPCTAR